jgi:hypothetical protein
MAALRRIPARPRRGAGERIFLAPLTIEPMSTTVFSGGAVAHVFAAHGSVKLTV